MAGLVDAAGLSSHPYQALSISDKLAKTWKGRCVDPRLNPYTPNAGARPPLLVGRDDQLAGFDVLLARLARGRHPIAA